VADTGNDRVQELVPYPPTTYTYDQAGNLTAVSRAGPSKMPAIEEAYAYDGTGLRTSQTVSGQTSHLTWDTSQGLPLLLDDDHASYIYGPTGLPVEQISEGTATFYHHDQLGSTRMLTNASGEAVGKFTYSAYGQPAGSTGTQTTPLGYAGQLTNEQSGLIYMRARVYDPVTGQFLTRDPLEAITREPYSYVGDNPVNRLDPRGLQGEEVKVPCWLFCEPPPVIVRPIEEGVHGAENALESVWNSITGTEDTEPSLTLSKAEAEYEEEHHECKLEEERRAEKGVPSEAMGRAREFVDKLGHPVNPNDPKNGSKLARVLAALAKLLPHR
jgi:RHS repeat-associated protein